MIEHFHDSKSTGIITPDTAGARDFSIKFIARWNSHYGTKIRVTFRRL